jgi:thioredoxin-related protein
MTKKPATRIIEAISNIIILLVAVVVGVVFYKTYYGSKRPPTIDHPTVGTALKIPGEDFKANKTTLIIALQQGCHYCAESVPFYQRIIEGASHKPDLHLVAVLPENDHPEYIRDLHLNIPDVKQVKFAAYHIGGTPTLIYVDEKGKAAKVWMGKLPPTLESEVIKALALECKECTAGDGK